MLREPAAPGLFCVTTAFSKVPGRGSRAPSPPCLSSSCGEAGWTSCWPSRPTSWSTLGTGAASRAPRSRTGSTRPSGSPWSAGPVVCVGEEQPGLLDGGPGPLRHPADARRGPQRRDGGAVRGALPRRSGDARAVRRLLRRGGLLQVRKAAGGAGLEAFWPRTCSAAAPGRSGSPRSCAACRLGAPRGLRAPTA